MKRRLMASLATGIAASFYGFGAAEAQTAAGAAAHAGDGVSDEVVVTARKREERLQDVPVAVTPFSAARLRDEGVSELRDLLQRAPSATSANLGTSFSAEIMLRGVGGGRQLNAEVATGQYRNGVFSAGGNIGGRNFSRMDLFDVERIEVLRGPQGALFGRNAVGGAINIISQRPILDEFQINAEAAYGSNERSDISAIVNAPIGARAALRASARYIEQNDGDFTNAPDGRVLDAEQFFGGRVGFRLEPTSDIALNFSIESFAEEGPSFSVFSYNKAAGADPLVRNLNTPAVFRRDETSIFADGVWAFDGAALTVTALHRQRHADTDDDFDSFSGVTAPAALPFLGSWRRISSDDFRRSVIEARLASSGGGRFAWLVGADYLTLDDDLNVELFGATGAFQYQNNTVFTSSDDWSASLFGSLAYDLSASWNVSGELRGSWDSKVMDSIVVTYPAPTFIETTRTNRFERDFDQISPTMTLSWRPSSLMNLYARYSQSYRAGGFNNEPDPAAPERFPVSYDAETTQTYEIGLKTTPFDGALMLNLAVYSAETEDLLVNRAYAFGPAGAQRTIISLENAGASEQAGFEAEASVRTTFAGGQVWLNATYSLGEGEIVSGPFDGVQLPRLRDEQASLGVIYRRPIGPLVLFANASYRGEWGGVLNANSVLLDDIEVLDARLGVEGESWSLTVSRENLSDDLFDGDRNAAGTQVYTSKPGVWALRLRVVQ